MGACEAADSSAWRRHNDRQPRFFSATYRLFKLNGLERDCEDYGQAVAYRSTLPGHSGQWALDKRHLFTPGKVEPVCGNTWRMRHNTRFKPYFAFFGEACHHLGIFESCGARLPFDTSQTEGPASAAGGSCC